MNYFSLNRNAPEVSFKDAVIKGIAPDKGLYFPKQISRLPKSFFSTINSLDNTEIAYRTITQFVGKSIDKKTLRRIVTETLSFDFPLIQITENISTLELFHGPTMAFKDVGARFMARCLGHFIEQDNTTNDITVLVATSGDTGGAVANGFLDVDGINVVILYPSGKVSDIQEKQLTSLGKNIKALEVDGTFDDCQAMVKKAFLDSQITSEIQLTSANSINIARWLSQMFYFMLAYKSVRDKERDLVFAVPSGNFGNICAGMMAYKLGLPVKQFIAAVNSNDVVPHYMNTETYITKPSIATISNAMDVGDPSNFIRIRQLLDNDFDALSKLLSSYSFSDTATKEAMASLYKTYNYIADPHGAVGYLGLEAYLKTHPEAHGIFLETAHPVKFRNVVEPVVGKELNLPKQIKSVINREKLATHVSSYEQLKEFLLT